MELSLKIVSVDSYLAKPIREHDPIYSHFTSTGISQVPVIRVFGITPTGEKGCLHVHGVFPYLFVPIPPDEANVDGFKHFLAKHLNDAINASSEAGRGNEGQHIYKITVVRGVPFYGYHSQNRDFFKIYLYRHFMVKQCAALLKNGAICNRSFQPHESHIPFTQQFFIDYNLYGMSWINLSNHTVRQYNLGSENGVPKATRCSFEADVSADDILNSSGLAENTGVKNPGLAYIWEDERIRRREEGQTSQISFVQYDNPNILVKSRTEEELYSRMKEALKERCRRGRVSIDTQSDESVASLGSGNPDRTYPLLDTQDMLLIENLADDWADEEAGSPAFEEGSVLGSQISRELDESSSEGEDNDADLTLPFHITDSDEDDCSQNDSIEMTIRYSSNSSGNNSDIMFVDGNVDDSGDSSTSSTPKKPKRKQKPSTPNRYNPLGVKVQKSPLKRTSNPSEPACPEGCQNSNSFDLSDFKRLQEIASSFPDTSQIGRCKNSTSSSSFEAGFNLSGDSMSKTQMETHSCGAREKRVRRKMPFDDVCDAEASSTSVVDDSEVISTLSNARSTDSRTPKCFTLSTSPPNPMSVLENANTHDLRVLPTKVPFYGNALDLPSCKETGFTRVTVKSHFARDLDEHVGELGCGLDELQKLLYANVFDLSPATITSSDRLLSYLSSKASVALTPLLSPPSRQMAEDWLENLKKTKASVEEHSIQRIVDDGCQEFVNPALSSQSSFIFNSQSSIGTQHFEPMKDPPSIEGFYSGTKLTPQLKNRRSSCQIDEATASNSGAFKMEFQNLQEVNNASMFTFLTICAMELHVTTRMSLDPNPEYDAVAAIFYVITNDVPPDSTISPMITGVVMVDTATDKSLPTDDTYCIERVPTEKDLFLRFLNIVHNHDPDIFVGYEIEMSSWGYLIQRGYIIGMNLSNELSRLLENTTFKTDPTATMKDYDIRISGRIVLNVWRMMRHEVSLMNYSFENMAYHILHTRVPHYPFQTLTFWWNHLSSKKRVLTMKYYLTRVRGIVKLLDSLNLIGRTSEMASLFGIQFYEVLSRGSQFRVESMMLRLAKTFNLIAVSPTTQQRAAMRAPACLPLIMEPESRFYSDPVIVLDFQSLYPSMMIAYNYCFSTCLGRVEEIIESDRFTFGCTELVVCPKEILNMKNHVTISPAGVVFVGPAVKKGVLPCMLDEILETRLMVKKSMKAHKNNKALHRILDARQLGLKLIANVTYGYTSANFSGRMPCIEVGDSVVSKGRETLENAIKLVKGTKRWNAEVVYGDTDSMFVLCRGRTKEEAFVIGQEIADAVTNSNPRPVKLKLEKVYQPCILQTKKRYVGYMYETPDQNDPVFEAKGIETVRRDGCIAVTKILEKSLRVLFETYDVSRVKQYVCDQLKKISSSKLNLQDLIFAREYRGMRAYKPTACVPALQLVREWLKRDPRAEPRVGERVGYCIAYGPPGVPLIQLVRDPKEVLADPTIHINSEYYITKVILPPLQRCFTLLGVDTFTWYKALPRIRKTQKRLLGKNNAQKATLSQFFITVNCVVCQDISTTSVCTKCRKDEQLVVALISKDISKIERKEFLLNKVCSSCCGRSYDLLCDSTECPIYYRKCLSNVAARELDFLKDAIEEF